MNTVTQLDAAGRDAHRPRFQAGTRPAGLLFRGLAIVLWRAGLRISEALALSDGDLERQRGAMLVRHGKGGKRREVGMDEWGWQQLDPWLKLRTELAIGALFCESSCVRIAAWQINRSRTNSASSA